VIVQKSAICIHPTGPKIVHRGVAERVEKHARSDRRGFVLHTV
jgi:hypothetical protein